MAAEIYVIEELYYIVLIRYNFYCLNLNIRKLGHPNSLDINVKDYNKAGNSALYRPWQRE